MTTPTQLSLEVRAILATRDLAAEPSDMADECQVRDEEGRWLFTVSTNINAKDLTQLLRYATRMRNEGIAIGKNEISAAMRALIGAAAQP